MCNPLLIGAALMAGGTAAQMHGQNRQATATNKAYATQIKDRTAFMQAERERQEKMDTGRQQEFQQVMDKTGTRDAYDQALDQAQQGRMAAYESNAKDVTNAGHYGAAPTGSVSPAGGNAGNRVVQDLAGQDRAQRNVGLQSQLQARAQLGSLGDALSGFGLARQPHAGRIDANQRSAQRSAGLLPGEMHMADLQGQYNLSRAQRKGQNARTLGQVMSTVGGAMVGNAAFAGGAGAAGGGGSSMAGHGYFNVPGIGRSGAILPRGFM